MRIFYDIHPGNSRDDFLWSAKEEYATMTYLFATEPLSSLFPLFFFGDFVLSDILTYFALLYKSIYMELKAGAVLQQGKYRILSVLGQGGFGITYLAEQSLLGRKVAIKEFYMKDLCNRNADTSQVTVGSVGSRELVDRFRQKFFKEACNIASLEHKHIVPIMDIFEENGTAYYVMKYFSGGSLSFNSAIPEDVALRYAKQLASALRFIHQKRMMHLDIKPSNILLDDEGNVVLIDFGLAKQYDNAGQQTSTTPVGISHGYAPIEQYRSGGVSAFSPATDIYSLGATLYKLLTGTTPPEAMDIVATGVPACPANVSAETWNAVKSAMQPAALSRPQSVDEFLSLLSEDGTEGRRPEGLKSKVKTENGKNKEENDGETELNGKLQAENENQHSVNDETCIDTDPNLINGHEYVDLGLPSGLMWATCNVGASTPEDYGDYYAWGEVETKNDYSEKTYVHCRKRGVLGSFWIGDYKYDFLGTDICTTKYDVARAKWGNSWRLPTKKEFRELINNCEWKWITRNGINGYEVKSKKNGNCIFLPATGWRSGSSFRNKGGHGYYWSATPNESSTDLAYSIYLSDACRKIPSYYRYRGYSVRPVFQNNKSKRSRE